MKLLSGGLGLCTFGLGSGSGQGKNTVFALFGVGWPRRLDLRSPIPQNRGRWASFDSSPDLEKCFLLRFFDTQNSGMRHPGSTALEAAEAGYLDPITSALMCKDCLQSFKLLAFKLRPWCSHLVIYRQGFGVLLYIPVRFNFLALKLRPWCGHPVMYRD